MRNIGIVGLLVLILGFASSVFAQKTGEDWAKETWERVQMLESPKKDDLLAAFRERRSFSVDTSDYWGDLMLLCWVEFFGTFEQVPEDQIGAFAKTYAGFLGTKGPEEDIRWVLSCLPFAGNVDLSRYNLNRQNQYNTFSIAFNQAVIENSLISPKYYRSMYYVTMWGRPHYLMQRNRNGIDSITWALRETGSDLFSLSLHWLGVWHFSPLPEKAKFTTNDPAYWHNIRVFLAIAYLCHWDRNFKDFESPVNHEYLQDKFTSFLRYYRTIANNPLYFNSLDFGNEDEPGMRYRIGPPKLPPFEFPNSPVPQLSIPFPEAGYEIFISELLSYMLNTPTEEIKRKMEEGW